MSLAAIAEAELRRQAADERTKSRPLHPVREMGSVFCYDCRTSGRAVTGSVTDPTTERRYCCDHARRRGLTGPKNERRTMPERKSIDWDQVQKERDAGATTTALAEKFHCSSPTICTHTKPRKGAKRAVAKPSANGHSRAGYDAVLADLRARRDELETAIAAIEKIR